MDKSERLIVIVLIVIGVLVVSMYVFNPFSVPNYDARGRVLGHIPYRIPSGAMQPTLMPGDFIIAKTFAYRSKLPERGDVIVFQYPKNSKIDYVKRVIGLPNEVISIVDGNLFVNHAMVNEPYLDASNLVRPYSLNMEEITVPGNSFFVLGDFRDNSNDSRIWGYVPLENLIGKISYIWWATDRSRIGNVH